VFHNVFWDSLRIVSLGVDMGSDVRLRSNEADIQLAGAVTLAKDAGTYRLDGILTAPRGTYRLEVPPVLSRQFTVTRGQVQYFGTPDLNAGLDIDAQYVVKRRGEDDVKVSVHLGGTLYVPRLTLSSDIRPPLANAEIISLLMFGTRRPEQLASGGNAAQFALDQLSGVLVGPLESTLGSLASSINLPLQYLQITPGELASRSLNGTQIALGFQVAPSLFVNVSPRICKTAVIGLVTPDNLGASLEFRLSQQWRVAASMDPAGTCGSTGSRSPNTGRQAGLDLFWEKRF
jgi:hypothetical protein